MKIIYFILLYSCLSFGKTKEVIKEIVKEPSLKFGNHVVISGFYSSCEGDIENYYEDPERYDISLVCKYDNGVQINMNRIIEVKYLTRVEKRNEIP